MKSLLLALIAASLALYSGCNTMPGSQQSIAQRALDKLLPAEFVGNLDLREDVPMWIGLTIKAGNVRRENGHWLFDWLTYDRNGPFGTNAHFTLGIPPISLPVAVDGRTVAERLAAPRNP